MKQIWTPSILGNHCWWFSVCESENGGYCVVSQQKQCLCKYLFFLWNTHIDTKILFWNYIQTLQILITYKLNRFACKFSRIKFWECTLLLLHFGCPDDFPQIYLFLRFFKIISTHNEFHDIVSQPPKIYASLVWWIEK